MSELEDIEDRLRSVEDELRSLREAIEEMPDGLANALMRGALTAKEILNDVMKEVQGTSAEDMASIQKTFKERMGMPDGKCHVCGGLGSVPVPGGHMPLSCPVCRFS